MPPDELTTLTLSLAAERSRENLLAKLQQLSALAPDELVSIVVEVLLSVGQDADRLKLRVAELMAARFAQSAETVSLAQLALFAKVLQVTSPPSQGNDGAPDASATATPTVPQLIERTNTEIDALVAAKRKAKAEEREQKRALRKAAASAAPGCWPTHLPIEERVIDVPPEQSHCGDSECDEERQVIGRETSWRLEAETTTKVVVTHRLIRACPKHHGGPVITPVEPAAVDGGHIGFGIAARSLWLRFAHNLPVHRIAEMWQADGLPISDDMLHTLFDTTARRVAPVISALIACVRASSVVNLDDTPVLILGTRAGPAYRARRRGRIWLALGDKKFAWFFATKSWKEAEAEQRLGKLTGVLQGDGYKGFPKLTRVLGIRQAGCMAHLRRKVSSGSPPAAGIAGPGNERA